MTRGLGEREGAIAPAPPGEPPVGNGTVGGTVTDLSDVLVRTLRALGDAGRPVRASRLAARAWWRLREDWPRQAERINGTMHYLARLPAEPDDGPTVERNRS